MAPIRTRLRPRHWGLAPSVVASLLGVALSTAAIMSIGWLALGRPILRIQATEQALEAVKIGLAVVAGLGGAFGLTVSYRRQRGDEGRHQGEQEAAFTARYTTAAEQLGHQAAAVRLAGVYALARLADDWTSQRRTCISVLCAYIRLPYDPEVAGEREVRLTVIRVIREHLLDGASPSWQGNPLDFTGACFDGGDFSDARFDGVKLSFADATFSGGTVTFERAIFDGGMVSFDGATISGGTVVFDDARFDGGEVSFQRSTFAKGKVSFHGARFGFGGKVNFKRATFDGCTASFVRAYFKEYCSVDFIETAFVDGRLNFNSALFAGGSINFASADFRGGDITFRRARFIGSSVWFADAKFTGSKVDFAEVDAWTNPPFKLPTAETSGLMLPLVGR